MFIIHKEPVTEICECKCNAKKEHSWIEESIEYRTETRTEVVQSIASTSGLTPQSGGVNLAGASANSPASLFGSHISTWCDVKCNCLCVGKTNDLNCSTSGDWIANNGQKRTANGDELLEKKSTLATASYKDSSSGRPTLYGYTIYCYPKVLYTTNVITEEVPYTVYTTRTETSCLDNAWEYFQ